MNGRLSPPPRSEWAPAARGREEPTSKCKPSCCKSPFGHAIGRDHLPAWHKDACHCHEPKSTGNQEGTQP